MDNELVARKKRRGETKRIPLDVDIDNPAELAIWEGYQEHGIAWLREVILKGMKPEPVPETRPSPFTRPAVPVGRSYSKDDQLGKNK